MAYELPKMNTKSTPSRTSNMLTLTITPEIKACLATVCKELGVSAAALVRDMITVSLHYIAEKHPGAFASLPERVPLRRRTVREVESLAGGEEAEENISVAS